MEIKRIAHRGLSSCAPENSVAAFSIAVEGEFYGVECDVWKSRDGVYVISHDGNLMRMCGQDRWIPDLTYDEMKKFPLLRGRRKRDYPLQYIPTISDYLSILSRVDTVHPVIELKMNYTTAELMEILNQVESFGLLKRTFFISMYPSVLIRLKEELGFPSDRLQYVYGATPETKYLPVSLELEQWLIQHRIQLDSRYTLLSRGNVMRLHEAGICVNVWTVNKKEDFVRLSRNFEVDMITTEYFFNSEMSQGEVRNVFPRL